MPYRVLILTTSTGKAGAGGPETGFDWMSLAVPYWRLHEAGVEIGFASILGGKPPGDPSTATLGETDAGERAGAVNMFLGDESAVLGLAQSRPVAQVAAEDWQALLVVDGTGALWDLQQTEAVAALVGALWAKGAVVATIGAGAAALLGARSDEDETIVAGARLTCLPAYSTGQAEPPYDLEDSLRQRGAQVFNSAPGEPPVVIEEGRLITGQDARTAADVALELLDALDVFAGASSGSLS